MLLKIQNQFLKVGITPTGAELASVTENGSDREFMWQADPAIWGSHAPVLFPVIGALRDGTYSFGGKRYPLPKHGFVRRNPNLRIIDHQSDQITFELAASPALKLIYPFDFRFRLTYRLVGNTLHQEHEILNAGQDPLYYSVGGHPAFRVPHFAGDRYSDHYLAFSEQEDCPSYVVDANGLLGPDTRPVPWEENRLPLTHDLFAHDALVFREHRSRSIELVSKNHGTILGVHFPDFEHLGIWAKPDGDFVCIEPWLGLTDPHDTDGILKYKPGIQQLAGERSRRVGFSVTFAAQ